MTTLSYRHIYLYTHTLETGSVLSCTWVRSHLEEITIRSNDEEMLHYFAGISEQNPVVSQVALEFD